MDVYDAGAYLHTFHADLPGPIRSVLWGPLQAKEMGLEGWAEQDGGETGMILHQQIKRQGEGMQTASLIVSNGARKARLIILQAGFDASRSEAHRDVFVKSTVSSAELFLSRIAKHAITFRKQRTLALVDFEAEASNPEEEVPKPAPTKPSAAPASPARGGSGVWEI